MNEIEKMFLYKTIQKQKNRMQWMRGIFLTILQIWNKFILFNIAISLENELGEQKILQFLNNLFKGSVNEIEKSTSLLGI